MTDEAIEPEPGPDPTPEGPDPEVRALEGCAGVPVTLSDGRSWLLREGGLLNALDDTRDKLYDQSVLNGKVDMAPVCDVAAYLLRWNYNLDVRETWTLILGLDADGRQALCDGVMTALFGDRSAQKTYTMWAASALLANGIDPTACPTSLLPWVTKHLVATGRALAERDFIDSAEATGRMAGYHQLLSRQAAARAPRPPAGPPTIISGTPPPAPETNGHG